MPKSWGHYGGSRDYELPTVPCKVSACVCNRRGKCEIPSKIDIRADGRCQTGVDFTEEAKQAGKKKG